ncbi:MAG TPA: YjbQ family protein [Ectothiorhodospiraceae bacterium]|nr:YjbQ family protein [Ectothiorhodospiraceae bacterium]
MVKLISIAVSGQGLHNITQSIEALVIESAIEEGICNILIQHTSASLTIQENADPSAKRDLENWLNRLVVENDSLYTHVLEGADDMPSHIKAALTTTSLSIPILNGALMLGTWQGIYLWEHRRMSSTRRIAVHIGS